MIFQRKRIVTYKGYVIREDWSPWAGGKIWFWQHDDAETEHDPRRGYSQTLDEAKGEIDDQIAEGVAREFYDYNF
jgi:hypothetical protein